MNTIEIRATILGARINMDWFRFRRKAAREYSDAAKLDATSQRRLRAQTDRMIRTLERHMKRANYRIRAALSQAEYEVLIKSWRAHVRWTRLHLAYFKPHRVCLLTGRKTAYQQVLNNLTVTAMRGIQDEGYKLPDPVQLRKVMRLYLAYTRRGRLPYPIGYMLNREKATGAGRVLCRFVEQRLDLVEVEE
jgi:hypothetical protein